MSNSIDFQYLNKYLHACVNLPCPYISKLKAFTDEEDLSLVSQMKLPLLETMASHLH